MPRALAPLLLLASLVTLAQSSTSPPPANWPANRWRAWFVQRQFGLDPWVYLRADSRVRLRCPPDQKLSIADIDSAAVTLQLIDDRRVPVVVVAECVIPYDRFRGQPGHGQLPDGRVLWSLQVGADESRNQDKPGQGKGAHETLRAAQ